MKRIIIALLLCLGAQGAFAQEVYNSSGKKGEAKRKDLKPKGFDASRLVLGGGAILSFGTGYANVGLSPMVGYKITDRFAAGIGIAYQYYRNKYEPIVFSDEFGNVYGPYPYDRKTSLYSGNIWLRYIVWRNLFVHAQPEMMNIGVPSQISQDPNTGELLVKEKREFVPAALVGLGLRQPITGSASLYILLLYDVVQDKRTPYYGNIDFRFGFNIGF
jgi:hypothetical protein